MPRRRKAAPADDQPPLVKRARGSGGEARRPATGEEANGLAESSTRCSSRIRTTAEAGASEASPKATPETPLESPAKAPLKSPPGAPSATTPKAPPEAEVYEAAEAEPADIGNELLAKPDRSVTKQEAPAEAPTTEAALCVTEARPASIDGQSEETATKTDTDKAGGRTRNQRNRWKAALPSNDVIHDRAFAPMTADDRNAWQGWTDIESDPAFFNFILAGVGIQDAKIQEIFSVDEASKEHLTKPVGLIFLYKVVEEDENQVVGDDCPDGLWFANQTTSNACATISMFNIAMNCSSFQLRDDLAAFKATTRDLRPALRGHLLSTHAGIRSVHNSFARRIDMLVSDLSLKIEWTEYTKRKKASSRSYRSPAKRSPAKQSSAKRKTKRRRTSSYDDDGDDGGDNDDSDNDNAAFHFIAYVPQDQAVWELNGMQEKPLRLGQFTGDDWLLLVRSRIAARMAAYAERDESAVFNLLAMCHAPRQQQQEDEKKNPQDPQDHPQPNRGSVGSTLDDGNQAAAEVAAWQDDLARAAGRTRDYTPVVHCWLKKLAENGALQHLATTQ